MAWQEEGLAVANAESAVARRHGRRSIRVAGGVVALGALALATVLFTATTAQAQAGPAPDPSPVGENVNSCDDVPPAGDSELFGGGSGAGTVTDTEGSGTSADGIHLDVTINAGFTATAIVVKGGSGANVYTGPFVGATTITGMVAPNNGSGGPAGLSHWIVCGTKTPGNTPTTETPVTTTEPPTSSSADPGGMPVTGSSLTGLIISGAALIVVGAGLLLFLRRRRDVGAPPAA